MYIFRNPKDVLVSYYHFCRMNKLIGFNGTFNEFFDRFVKGTLPYGPIWSHYIDVLKLKEDDLEKPFDHNNVLVLFYEDLKKDFAAQVHKISEFLNKPRLSDDAIKVLAKHCSFDEMKNNPAVNYQHWDDLGFRDKKEASFMRKGQVGDWKNYFSPDQDAVITKLIDEKLGDKISFIYEE